MDLDARFKTAEEKMKSAEYLGQAFAIIAQAVMDLNDSHTRFYPPARNSIVEYGWRMKAFGDRVFVTGVKDGSDAEARGLKIGDEVLKMNGFPPSRKDLWKMTYYYQILNPQTKIALDVQTGDAESRHLDIAAKVTMLKAIVNFTDSLDFNQAQREGGKLESAYKHYFKDVGTAMIWKMPDFAFDPAEVEGFIGRAKDKQSIILDLRGNPGGYVVTLEKLAGYFFDKEIKIADLVGRKKLDPQVAKPHAGDMFTGKVIVLVDSNSASASEIFARLMQLQKRGVVLGDNSAGAVMQSRGIPFDAGAATVISYGMNMTMADVIMSDGKSLEHVGVTPDELIVPTGQDLANRRDPVLPRALEIAGIKVDADSAGKYFPEEKFVDRSSNVVINLRSF